MVIRERTQLGRWAGQGRVHMEGRGEPETERQEGMTVTAGVCRMGPHQPGLSRLCDGGWKSLGGGLRYLMLASSSHPPQASV